MCMRVDLPDPEGPMIAVKRSRSKSTLTSVSASTAASPSPKRRLTSLACTMAPLAAARGSSSRTFSEPVSVIYAIQSSARGAAR